MFATVLWMLGATASFSLMAVAGRELSSELSTFEIMLYRSVIGLIMVVAWAALAGRLATFRTTQLRRHAVRNIWHFTGQNLWFYALAVIPLAQLVALEFTNPLWVAMLAPFMLGERLTARRIGAVLLGFVGILIVARPGVAPIEIGHFSALGAALGFALNSIITRKIARTDSVACVLFWMCLMQTGFAFVISAALGITVPSTALWGWVGIIGLCGMSAHLCLTKALSLSPATIVAPLEFVRLPVIATVGAMVYGEPLEVAVFVGAAVIVVANLINLTGSRRAVPPQGAVR